jgi:hypothetical protein
MKRAQINRLELLKHRLGSKAGVVHSLCDWDCGKDDCPLCGLEAQRYQEFYRANCPSVTGCTWEAFFYAGKDAGFHQEHESYEDYLTGASEW